MTDANNNWWIVTGTFSPTTGALDEHSVVTAIESADHVAAGTAVFTADGKYDAVFAMNSATSLEAARAQGKRICEGAAMELSCEYAGSSVIHESDA